MTNLERSLLVKLLHRLVSPVIETELDGNISGSRHSFHASHGILVLYGGPNAASRFDIQ